MKKKFKFVLIEVSYLSNGQYWFLLIENLMGLMNYYEKISPALVENYFKLKPGKPGGHPDTKEQEAIFAMFFKDIGSKGVIDDMFHISDCMLKNKTDMILKGEKLLINSTGIGYCNFNKKFHKIIKIVESNNYLQLNLTEKDINITKWNGGKHYYLRIGTQDFGKFATVKMAEKVGKEKLDELINIGLEKNG